MKIFATILESANVTSATFNSECKKQNIDASDIIFSIIDAFDTLPSELEKHRQVLVRRLAAEQRKLPSDAQPYYGLTRADAVISDMIESSKEFQIIQDKLKETKLAALI